MKYTKYTIYITVIALLSMSFGVSFALSAKNPTMIEYISTYRLKRDTSNSLERQLNSTEQFSNYDYFSSRKKYLASANDVMISYLKNVKTGATDVNPPEMVRQNSDYQALDNDIKTLKDYSGQIKSTDNLYDLKALAKRIKNSWNSIKSSTPNHVCGIFNARNQSVVDDISASLNALQTKIPKLKKKNKDTTRLENLITALNQKLDKLKGDITKNVKCNTGSNYPNFKNTMKLVKDNLKLLDPALSDLTQVNTEYNRLSEDKK